MDDLTSEYGRGEIDTDNEKELEGFSVVDPADDDGDDDTICCFCTAVVVDVDAAAAG